jgi:hypothetical protein
VVILFPLLIVSLSNYISFGQIAQPGSGGWQVDLGGFAQRRRGLVFDATRDAAYTGGICAASYISVTTVGSYSQSMYTLLSIGKRSEKDEGIPANQSYAVTAPI